MVIFYHELNHTSGGAAVLIINLIKGLVAENVEVALINFKDGVLHKELAAANPSLLTVINNDKESIIQFANSVSSDDIIISTHFYSVFRLFKKANPRFLFYSVGHVQLIEANRFFKVINFLGLTKKLIQLLEKKKGIVFIEQNALNKTVELLDLNSENFSMLPIPVLTIKENEYLSFERSDTNKEIRCTYVGRAVDSKMFPVRKMVSDIMALTNEFPIVILHIVTDDANEFRSILPTSLIQKIEIRFYENLPQKDLDKFLLSNSDLHFGHATSALEGAKLGIPTVLIDFAFKEFPDNYTYSFIYQTAPEYIGTDANEGLFINGMGMEELLKLTANKEKMRSISQECYQYIQGKHDLSIISSKLIQYIEKCECRISDMKKYLIRYQL